MRWERPAGIRLETLGEAWVAYSPLSGDSLMLTNESAAILEVLDGRPCALEDLCAVLAQDSGLPVEHIAPLVEQAAPNLVAAGLVRLR